MLNSFFLYVLFVVAFFLLLLGVTYFTADVREESLRSANQLRRPRLADGVAPWLRDILLSLPVRRFDNVVQTCGIKARTENVLIAMMALTVASMAVLDWFLPHPVFSFVGGVFFGIVLPLLVLLIKRNRRMTKLTHQLPETLNMMVRSLRAGHPIPVCIQLVANEMPEPIGGEFKRVFDAMSFGLDLRESLIRMTERLHTVNELKYVVSAIRIQATSGGNLAEILDSLSRLMRDQQKLKMKVKAISAEGRVSGHILAAIPILLVVIVNTTTPTYYQHVGERPGLMAAMCVGAALLVLGIVIIRRIVNIRV
jgi:tight adherence protein B